MKIIAKCFEGYPNRHEADRVGAVADPSEILCETGFTRGRAEAIAVHLSELSQGCLPVMSGSFPVDEDLPQRQLLRDISIASRQTPYQFAIIPRGASST
jgi:hypothetical protein